MIYIDDDEYPFEVTIQFYYHGGMQQSRYRFRSKNIAEGYYRLCVAIRYLRCFIFG